MTQKRITLTSAVTLALEKLIAVLDKNAEHDRRLQALEAARPTGSIVRLQCRPELPPVLADTGLQQRAEVRIPPQYTGCEAFSRDFIGRLPPVLELDLTADGKPYEFTVLAGGSVHTLPVEMDVAALAKERLALIAKQDEAWENAQLPQFALELESQQDVRSRAAVDAGDMRTLAKELPDARERWRNIRTPAERLADTADGLLAALYLQNFPERSVSDEYWQLERLIRDTLGYAYSVAPEEAGAVPSAEQLARAGSAEQAATLLREPLERLLRKVQAAETALDVLEDLLRRYRAAAEALGGNPDTAKERAALNALTAGSGSEGTPPEPAADGARL